MNHLQSSHLSSAKQLQKRLELLGVTLCSVAPDGWVTILSASQWIERLLTDTTEFTEAVGQREAAAELAKGRVVEVGRGVRLVPLPLRKKTRSERRSNPGRPIQAAIMLSADLLESEWLDVLASSHQLGREAILGRIDQDKLLGPAELERTATMLGWLQQDASDIDRRNIELHALSQQLSETYEELSLLYKLSSGMIFDQPRAQFLTDACNELRQVLGLRWVAVQLRHDVPALTDLAGKVFYAGGPGSGERQLREVGRQIMLQWPSSSLPRVIDDTRDPDIPQLASLGQRLFVISLSCQGKRLGILIGGDKMDGSPISSVDIKLCGSLANSLSIFLENTTLYEDVQGMFMGTLHALTRSIDAKDSYTFGHSERVAMLAKQLAAAADLEDDTVERVYLSGLVHDVGKIGVPESVLCKSGSLTTEEFNRVKQHPLVGARILSEIHQMKDLIPGVLYHHEWWNGAGYPHRISGEDIPLFGRLICLADSFDAMSSNRTYRRSMTHDEALAEVQRCAGTQFDPTLAELFMALDFGAYQELIHKHQTEQASNAA